MPEHGTRSTYSQAPFQILMYDRGGIISSGTAFNYEHDGKRFLITNWHNVSGRNFQTKEKLDVKTGRVPTHLICKIAQWCPENEGSVRQYSIMPRRIELFDDPSAMLDPLWLEHPELGSTCDVVAIEHAKPTSEPEFMHWPVNKISHMRIPVKPGQPAFIIGFPEALSTGYGLPIWKSGYIASEPYYSVTIGGELTISGARAGGLSIPAFFIDSQTRRGMSGSPIFASFTGMWSTTDPYENVDPDEPNFWNRADVALHATGIEFAGVYSGRAPGQIDDAALGLCWRKDVIDQICAGGVRGAVP